MLIKSESHRGSKTIKYHPSSDCKRCQLAIGEEVWLQSWNLKELTEGHLRLSLTQHGKSHPTRTQRELTDWGLFLDSVGGGGWSFFVGRAICLAPCKNCYIWKDHCSKFLFRKNLIRATIWILRIFLNLNYYFLKKCFKKSFHDEFSFFYWAQIRQRTVSYWSVRINNAVNPWVACSSFTAVFHSSMGKRVIYKQFNNIALDFHFNKSFVGLSPKPITSPWNAVNAKASEGQPRPHWSS